MIFKNLPLRSHKLAQPAAIAALAAGQQGKFWEYHDKLFLEKVLTPASFERIAQELELDLTKFNMDRKSPLLIGHMRNDMREAQQLGITSTPSIFVNGKKLKQRSLQGFQRMIDDALKKVTP